MGFDVEITVSGPVFDGRAEAAAAAFCRHWEEEMGDKGVAMIRAYLPTVYQYLSNPASLGFHGTKNHFIPGYYQSVIHKLDAGDSVLIHDTPCVYGPWLEGVGSRNATTRFKGYHTFRIIAQQLDRMAVDVAYAELPPYIEEMN
jgi:hypothetical protein